MGPKDGPSPAGPAGLRLKHVCSAKALAGGAVPLLRGSHADCRGELLVPGSHSWAHRRDGAQADAMAIQAAPRP